MTTMDRLQFIHWSVGECPESSCRKSNHFFLGRPGWLDAYNSSKDYDQWLCLLEGGGLDVGKTSNVTDNDKALMSICSVSALMVAHSRNSMLQMCWYLVHWASAANKVENAYITTKTLIPNFDVLIGIDVLVVICAFSTSYCFANQMNSFLDICCKHLIWNASRNFVSELRSMCSSLLADHIACCSTSCRQLANVVTTYQAVQFQIDASIDHLSSSTGTISLDIQGRNRWICSIKTLVVVMHPSIIFPAGTGTIRRDIQGRNRWILSIKTPVSVLVVNEGRQSVVEIVCW